MSKSSVDIIIPTWNNPEDMHFCVKSIIQTGITECGFGRLIVVNNGKQPLKDELHGLRNVSVIDSPENLGWEGGLKKGLEKSDAPFVVFQNDDTVIPTSSLNFYEKMLIKFRNPDIAAVGPITTTAAGCQSIYSRNAVIGDTEVRWLIFFTVMLRRADLDAVGGVDDTLPGGDDFDLSIRLRQAGKKLLVTPQAFIIHAGFRTGTRVHGDHNRIGGWNSREMTDRTNQALIRKHGFKTFFDTISAQVNPGIPYVPDDKEGCLISSFIEPQEKVVELGCGGKKTVAWAVGVDRVPKGTPTPILHGLNEVSVADVVADVEKPLPFSDNEFDVVVARHILEHCTDTVQTLKEWTRILKPGGRLILALPDETKFNTIPLDPTHYHAFTQDSIKHLADAIGFAYCNTQDTENQISFLAVLGKPVVKCEPYMNSLDRFYEGDVTAIPLNA